MNQILCTTSGNPEYIRVWCSNGIHLNGDDITQTAVQYCEDLLMGVRVTGEMGNVCTGDPAICATHNAMEQAAESRAIAFPELTYLATLSKDQLTIALSNGKPCHVETYDGENYHKRTWWYCYHDGSYMKAYTFINGKLDSTYHP